MESENPAKPERRMANIVFGCVTSGLSIISGILLLIASTSWIQQGSKPQASVALIILLVLQSILLIFCIVLMFMSYSNYQNWRICLYICGFIELILVATILIIVYVAYEELTDSDSDLALNICYFFDICSVCAVMCTLTLYPESERSTTASLLASHNEDNSS